MKTLKLLIKTSFFNKKSMTLCASILSNKSLMEMGEYTALKVIFFLKKRTATKQLIKPLSFANKIKEFQTHSHLICSHPANLFLKNSRDILFHEWSCFFKVNDDSNLTHCLLYFWRINSAYSLRAAQLNTCTMQKYIEFSAFHVCTEFLFVFFLLLILLSFTDSITDVL